jgi:outer membrane protein TolC
MSNASARWLPPEIPRSPQAWARTAGVLMGAALLAGCASFSADGGMDVVQGIAAREVKKDVIAVRSEDDAVAVRAATKRLLSRPLTADAAVQIALLNNRGLQAAYNELGISEARMISASLPANPRITITHVASGTLGEFEAAIVGDILSLATLPLRSDIAANRFRQAQLRAAEATMRVAGDARRAYYRAVAARQLEALLTQTQSAADDVAELSKRLGETGALNKLDQAREQVFYAEVTAQLARARRTAASERERLTRVMGLWGNDVNFKLPGTLPALPAPPKRSRAIEQEAMRRRIDLQIGRIELVALAKSYGLTQATRFVNALDLGPAYRRTREGEPASVGQAGGVEVEFQIPIFDFGEVRVREAEQTYLQAVNQLAQRAINARSEARDAFRTQLANYELARFYVREVLPLRKIISDETMLRYNTMQIDVFALLAEARQRIAANTAAVEALRDYWVGSSDLVTAVLVGSGNAGSAEAHTISTTTAENSGQ